MTPYFALAIAAISFWLGLYIFGWQFVTGVIWLGAWICASFWYAFGEVKPAKKPFWARVKGMLGGGV